MFQKASQDGVSKEQVRHLAELLDRYQAVFSRNDQVVVKTDMVKHSIPVQEETRPIRHPPRRHWLGPQKKQEAEPQIQDMLARRTIEPASGAWRSPVVLVRKKYAQEKSTFATRSGLWKWKVLLFGLTSTPATFQRLMEQVLHRLH